MPDFEIGPTFDAVDIGIIVLDAERRIVAWNDWMARVAGQSKQAVAGKRLHDIFPNMHNGRLDTVIGDAFEAGSSSILTHSLNRLLPLRGEGGRELLHNVVVRPIFAANARYCLLQINDVTVSVTRERVLRERQNARYHAIVDSAPDTIITAGLDGTVHWMNSAAERAFGYTQAELLGRKIDILIQNPGSLARAFAEGGDVSARSLQILGRRKDGQTAYFDVSFARWKTDERIFVSTIWRDETERMEAEIALRDSEGRQRALLEALPQLVWACGPDGLCDYVNPQWQTYAGTPAEGSGWLKTIHPSDRDGLEAAWASSLASGDIFDIDARLRNTRGEYRWFKMRSIPVRARSKKITRWFGTATDITDHIAARNALLQSNEELEARVVERTREREAALGQLHESQKMETIGQLTGGVAHDFNNLLAVILGSLALLKKSIPDDPRTSRLLEGAIQGAERGATLTKRLLAFARRQELKTESVEIQKLIPDLLGFLQQTVGPSIAIFIDIAADAHSVRVDANQLELALMNLAVNARDAMPKGGSLTISGVNETVDEGAKIQGLAYGEYVRIVLTDTGEGMSETTLSKAMEPFFTTKGIGKGTGLGLSMVQGLMAQSGGAMHIASRIGKGTVVTLWLPHARKGDIPQAVPTEAVSHSEDSSQRLRVLLVDDDALVSMAAADMLMDLGHSVLEAPSAMRALELVGADSKFDVIVTDYAMPGMNGLDLAMKIREINPKLPIILATGYAELPRRAAPIKFLRLDKPYTQEQLGKVLKTALEEHASKN